MYPDVCYTSMPFIYVDVHLKTILVITLFSIKDVLEARVSEDGVYKIVCPVKFQDVKFKIRSS